jgi:AcrR family transcriptional regulator
MKPARATAQRRRGRPRDEALAARRCEEILETATQMFATRGYQDMDVQVAADALCVGKGTVYRYFPTKRELFLAAVDRAMRLLRDHVEREAATRSEPLDRVEAAVRAYLAFFEAHPEFVELLILERAEFKDRKKPTYFVHRDANLGQWEDLFRALIAQGTVRDVPVARITTVLGDLLYGTMFTNFFASRAGSEAQADDILDVLLHGILTPAGQRRRAGRGGRSK